MTKPQKYGTQGAPAYTDAERAEVNKLGGELTGRHRRLPQVPRVRPPPAAPPEPARGASPLPPAPAGAVPPSRHDT